MPVYLGARGGEEQSSASTTLIHIGLAGALPVTLPVCLAWQWQPRREGIMSPVLYRLTVWNPSCHHRRNYTVVHKGMGKGSLIWHNVLL